MLNLRKIVAALLIVCVLTPLGAAAACLVVVLAALCLDGVAPSVRNEAVVFIDGGTGFAATHTRALVKTQFTTRGGMVFTRATEVSPRFSRWRGGRHARRVEFTENAQRFNNAWLPPRTPEEFLLRHAGPVAGSVQLLREDAQGLEVANHLGARAEVLFAVGSDGTLHRGENIPDGAVATLRPVKRKDTTGHHYPFVYLFDYQHGSYQAVVDGAPFTEAFLPVKTKSSGRTHVYGTFAKGESQ